jgi:hypothetical protein
MRSILIVAAAFLPIWAAGQPVSNVAVYEKQ